MKRSVAVTLGVIASAALVLTACSSTPAGSDATSASASGSAAESGSANDPGSSSGAPESESGDDAGSPSPEPSQSTILAVLCDEAAPSQAKAIKAAIRPEFKVSQLVDVRTDDKGKHAILGFVEGPGLSVLAVWSGTGMNLEGLASADDLAAQASTAEKGTPDEETAELIGQTVTCYQTLFAPEGFS